MRGRRGWGTQECQGRANTLCDSVRMDTGHGTHFHRAKGRERGNYGPRVTVTGQCSCIGCNKCALWLTMLIMEESECGWPAVGSGRGTVSVGRTDGGKGKASEQEGWR